MDNIIAKLEELRFKESIYNDAIIPDLLITKDEVMLILTKVTFIFK